MTAHKVIRIRIYNDLSDKLKLNKINTGLSINKQINQAINNYFKYQNKSRCKKF